MSPAGRDPQAERRAARRTLLRLLDDVQSRSVAPAIRVHDDGGPLSAALNLRADYDDAVREERWDAARAARAAARTMFDSLGPERDT